MNPLRQLEQDVLAEGREWTRRRLEKQLLQRLRGCGQIWSRPGFTRLLRVVVLVKNQDVHLLWS